jgi:hypothetical protein
VVGRGFLTLFLILLAVSGCSNSSRETREILQILSARKDALNARDLERYLAGISRHYNDRNKNFAQLAESQKNNFKTFEQVLYEADTPSIVVSGNSAVSTGSYRMKVIVQGKEVTFKGTEHLKLVKEPEGWKIIAGI